MPEPVVYEFSKYIGAFCVRANKNVHQLGAALGLDPMLLLRMINGRRRRPRQSLAEAKELEISESHLDKLAEEVRRNLQ